MDKAFTDSKDTPYPKNDSLYTVINDLDEKYQNRYAMLYTMMESHKDHSYTNIMLRGARGQMLEPNQIWLVYVEVCTSVSNRQCTCNFKLYYVYK